MQIVSIPSNTSYSNLQTLSGYTVGTSFLLTNNTSQPLFLVQSALQPTNVEAQFPVHVGQTVVLEANISPYWIKGEVGPVLVQLPNSSISPYSVVDLPDEVWAGDSPANKRLKVDPERTSFQDNRQFRLFDRLLDILPTDQVVYYFQTVYPLFIILRMINVYSGGREYLVYGVGDFSFTGTLGSPLPIRNVNGHLRAGTLVHPTSGVVVRKAVGAGIFTPNTTLASNGTMVASSISGASQSSVYTPDGIKSGVSAGQSFYLVLNHIGPTTGGNNTFGQFNLSWEELF
jgi:hypothetical protein